MDENKGRIFAILGLSILFIGCLLGFVNNTADAGQQVLIPTYEVYSEGYYHNENTPLTIEITAPNTTTNITGFSIGDYKAMTFYANGVNVDYSGMYKFSGSISFVGANGQEYGFGMTKNGTPIQDCGMGKTASVSYIENVAFSCFTRLEAGDHLNIVVKDKNAPAQDIDIYKMTINIMRIGG